MTPQQRHVGLGRQVDVALVESIFKLAHLLVRQSHILYGLGVFRRYELHDALDGREQIGRQRPPLVGGGEYGTEQRIALEHRCLDRNHSVGCDPVAQLGGLAAAALRNVGVRQQPRDVDMVELRLCILSAPAVRLQLGQTFDKGIYERLAQRVTHSDVDPLQPLGQRVEQRQEQILVGQHYGRALVELLGRQRAQYVRDIFALYGIRGAGYRLEALVASQQRVVRYICRGRKERQILADEHTGFVLLAVGIPRVVVPQKLRAGAVRGYMLEYALLALRQCVVTCHDITSRGIGAGFARGDPLCRRAVGHALIGHAQRGDPLAETAVYVGQCAPDVQKLAFLFGQRRLVAEAAPECDYALLLGRKIRYVGFELLYLFDVAQQHAGIDHVFVDHVEVGKQHLAPEVELVESLVRVVLCVYLI